MRQRRAALEGFKRSTEEEVETKVLESTDEGVVRSQYFVVESCIVELGAVGVDQYHGRRSCASLDLVSAKLKH